MRTLIGACRHIHTSLPCRREGVWASVSIFSSMCTHIHLFSRMRTHMRIFSGMRTHIYLFASSKRATTSSDRVTCEFNWVPNLLLGILFGAWFTTENQATALHADLQRCGRIGSCCELLGTKVQILTCFSGTKVQILTHTCEFAAAWASGKLLCVAASKSVFALLY